MMISFKFLDNCIELKDGVFSVLVIENKKLFRNVVCAFESENAEDYFVFSKDFKPIDFGKVGVFVSNPLNVELDGRKLLTKINSYLEDVANTEYEMQLAQAKQALMILADSLSCFGDFDCEYNNDITTAEIIKLLQFKVGREENMPEELLITYLKLVSKYLKTELFVVPNLHLLFTDEEVALIYETLAVNHIKMLSLECFEPAEKNTCEEIFIVDKDLCEIDKSDI